MELPLTLPLRLSTTCVAHQDIKQSPLLEIPRIMARLNSLEEVCSRVSDIIIPPTTMKKRRNFALYARGARILPDLTSPINAPKRGSRIWEWARGHIVDDADIDPSAVVLGIKSMPMAVGHSQGPRGASESSWPKAS